jgi:hypothetical protein
LNNYFKYKDDVPKEIIFTFLLVTKRWKNTKKIFVPRRLAIFITSFIRNKKIKKEETLLHLALEKFEKIIKNRFFEEISVLLLLSGKSNLKDSLLKHSFKDYFPEYKQDETDELQISHFIRDLFLRKNSSCERSIYYFFTDLFDTQNVTVFWNAMREISVRIALKNVNLI